MEWYNIVLMIAMAGVEFIFCLIAIGGIVMVKQKKDHGWKVVAWAGFMIIVILAMAARMGAG